MISPTSAVMDPFTHTAGFRQGERAPGQGQGELFPTPAVAGSEPTGDTPSRSRVARDVGYRRASAWGCPVNIYEIQQQPTGEGAVTGWQ